MLTARLLIKDYNRFLPLVDDFGDFILTEDGKQIMPGSPEEKALYEEGGDSFGGSEMSEEEMIKELQKLDM